MKSSKPQFLGICMETFPMQTFPSGQILKKGAWHESNRIEVPQPINKNQFIGFVKIFSTLYTNCYVTQRESYNFIKDNITVTLVKAKKLAYIEFEILSNKESEQKDSKAILDLMNIYKLSPINQVEFDDLCERLKDNDDWVFELKDEHLKKLEELLKEY